MANIVFPASPYDGQVFVANNGVIYVWSASKGIWQTAGVVAPLGMDFFAASGGNYIGGGGTIVPKPPVLSGNAGGYYNASTGRWTPPAGRYFVWAGYFGSYSGGATQITTTLRKNGSNLYGGVIITQQVPAFNNWGGDPESKAIVDMNGTDYIDYYVSANNGVDGTANTWFGAFPVALPVVVPQMPNTLQMYSSAVAIGGETTLDVLVPINAHRVDLQFSFLSTSGADVNVSLNSVENGVVNTSNNHVGQLLAGAGATPSAAAIGTSTAWVFSSTARGWGTFSMFPFIGGSVWAGDLTFSQRSNAGIRQTQKQELDGGANPATTTGFRLTIGGGTSFSAGSYFRSFVIP